MQSLPHIYSTTFRADPDGDTESCASELPALRPAPPPQFGGPDGQWSPEELLMASLSSCLILSFKAVARAAKLQWTSIECTTTGTLDKVDGSTRFVEVQSQVVLTIPDPTHSDKARKLVERAEQTCFIANSLNCDKQLVCELHSLSAL